MKKVSTTGKVIGILLVTAAIGGALAMIFAPKKVSEAKRKLSDKSEDLLEEIKKGFSKVMAEKALVDAENKN